MRQKFVISHVRAFRHKHLRKGVVVIALLNEEARMDDRALNQSSAATGKFSMLDWPTPEMLQAANRARARAMRDMIIAFGKWAMAFMTSHPISNSPQDMAGSDAPRVAPKR